MTTPPTSRSARRTPARRGTRRHPIGLAVVALLSSTWSAAQDASADNSTRVTVTGTRAQQPVSIAGFGDVPLSELPLSATVITRRQLADAGISSLADITRLDADITDAYNAPGYVNQLAVRGFTLDNRFNFRRDGLPVNGETVLGQANKQALELIKGTSGLQAGTSSPAGLVNLVVKRPTGRVREASLSWAEPGTTEVAIDVGDRASTGSQLGWRLNAAAARLDPHANPSRGDRYLLAAAADARLGPGLIEAEIEISRQSQPSTPGFSLLGNRLPAAASIDPRLNLNNQPWSLPVVFEGTTGSLRYSQTIATRTELVAHIMRQQLRNDDRIAFPYGCSSEDRYDRYCSDGSFDFYDFRSEGERRTSDAVSLSLTTRQPLMGMQHRIAAGVLLSRHEARFQDQAYNWVGIGTIDGLARVPADPTLTDVNTNRRERSAEVHVQDQIVLSPRWTAWAGARHTTLTRSAVRTDGSRPTDYRQDFTTPWLAVSYRVAGASDGPASDRGGERHSTLLYASTGQGVESEVTPNRSRYVNAGEALPALKSRQFEVGIRSAGARWSARAAVFDIRRPAWNDIHPSTGGVARDDCSDADPCVRRADGASRHTGLEAEAEWRSGNLSLRGSAMTLRARREGSVDASLNGLRPTNVPAHSVKAQAAWSVPQVRGLTLLAFVVREGQRMVLPDNSIATPGWTRVDLGARWSVRPQASSPPWVLRVGVDNVTDRRAWQEAPYQYGHAYLYPLTPRTWRASAELRF